jgi:hydroxylamine reductase
MFCYQCQEAAKGTGCTIAGVCGKKEDLANMQDLLIYVLKGVSIYATKARELGIENEKANKIVFDGLFMTITNANFDNERFVSLIKVFF